jgi:hypothetical protein
LGKWGRILHHPAQAKLNLNLATKFAVAMPPWTVRAARGIAVYAAPFTILAGQVR